MIVSSNQKRSPVDPGMLRSRGDLALFRVAYVCAGANRPETPGRGLLTGEALVDRDLSGLELGVLSACETGLGDVAGGEGVFGLQRVFHLAGTRNVVASLWKVHDAATSVLMEEFYTNLWQKKLSKLEALRQAQLTVLREPARVERRLDELVQEQRKRGEPAEASAVRALRERSEVLPSGQRRSPTAWWAGFVLSRDGR
jgi:CHAT domain-containing protein